ncbi:MAG: dihydroneopterin aldolase [Candidatus Celaenobacter polaris]|nr:dihydroneopterin aldolase [Candidatus Celaenobacter polaris]
MNITLKNMIFYGYHGLHEAERTLGQRFAIDVNVSSDHELDNKVKSLRDTIDYTQIFEVVKERVENYKYHLLEKLANEIISAILNDFILVQKVSLKIRKIAVPINGTLDYVELEMQREREKKE